MSPGSADLSVSLPPTTPPWLQIRHPQNGPANETNVIVVVDPNAFNNPLAGYTPPVWLPRGAGPANPGGSETFE